jgi:hypothetical protein
MKKFLTFTAFALLSIGLFGQDANRLHYVQIYGANAKTEDNAGVDISAYKGNATFVCSIGEAVGGNMLTNVITLAHSADNISFATITNILGNAGVITSVVGTNEHTIATYPIDLGRLHKYVRASSVNYQDTNSVSVILVAPMKAQ